MGFKLGEMHPWLDLFMDEKLSPSDHIQLITKKIVEVDERMRVLQRMNLDLTEKLRALKEGIVA